MEPMRIKPISHHPLVSIIITNYNYGQYVGKAIESALKQTYQHFEIIICDDGSTDNSLDTIRTYAERDDRIQFIAKQNGGQASALNAAFQHARGEIVSFLDADDVWFPCKLEKTVQAFRTNPQAGFVYHRLRIIYTNGRFIRDYPKIRSLITGWLLPESIHHFCEPPAPSSAISLHRDVALRVFPLPDSFRSTADAVICLRASTITVCYAVPEVLGTWTQHGGNLTSYGQRRTAKDIERHISMARSVLQDKEYFVKINYPTLVIDRKRWEEQSLGLTLCTYYLYSGNHPNIDEIKKYRRGIRLLWWRLLFALPKPFGKLIHQAWTESRLHSFFAEL